MNKNALIVISILLIMAFFAGRSSVTEKVKIETVYKTVEVEKVTNTFNKDVTTTALTISKPNGTVLTRVKTKSNTKEESKKESVKDSSLSESKTITRSSGVTVMALVGLNLNDYLSGLKYGVSVSKPFIGPINIGVFGLLNGTVGGSLGVTF